MRERHSLKSRTVATPHQLPQQPRCSMLWQSFMFLSSLVGACSGFLAPTVSLGSFRSPACCASPRKPVSLPVVIQNRVSLLKLYNKKCAEWWSPSVCPSGLLAHACECVLCCAPRSTKNLMGSQMLLQHSAHMRDHQRTDVSAATRDLQHRTSNTVLLSKNSSDERFVRCCKRMHARTHAHSHSRTYIPHTIGTHARSLRLPLSLPRPPPPARTHTCMHMHI